MSTTDRSTPSPVPTAVAREMRERASRLQSPDDLDPVLERIGDARHVLIGEASHGTSEYYRWRATLTRRLIEEHGFSFVAVEGDWPDCYKVNRWVKGRDDEYERAEAVLADRQRWPTWMWANEEVADFVTWLRRYNAEHARAVGFYGLDVYSLWDSLRIVLGYLRRERPDDVEAARAAIHCFEPHAGDPQSYAASTRLVPEGCEQEVVDLLLELRGTVDRIDGDPEARFDAEQNSAVLRGAEEYYRTMVRGGPDSWNIRDRHMAATLDRLIGHHGPACRTVTWEHNTHVGDARATDMTAAGMVNVGQLVRERRGPEGVFIVGFGGHRGSVLAADHWGGVGRRMDVPSAPEGTHEALLQEVLGAPAVLDLSGSDSSDWLSQRRGHRAIGVVYDPGRDHLGNWVPTELGHRYDTFLYFDKTSALHPLVVDDHARDELETYPWSA